LTTVLGEYPTAIVAREVIQRGVQLTFARRASMAVDEAGEQ
jgi:hypothetical protein